jgi:hypothetical protein
VAYLIPNSTPAQRARGQSFGEKFISAAKVALNGGTVTGTPTIDFGATLNGTTDYFTYNVNGQELYSSTISFRAIFIPEFEADDGLDHYIFDTIGPTANGRYLIDKMPSAQSNQLLVVMGGNVPSFVGKIPIETYKPFWRVGEVNEIVASGTSGNTTVWLNNNIILNATSVAWSPGIISTLYVGRFNGAAVSLFKGKIIGLEFYKSLLTADEVSDFWTNSTYNYRNQAIGDWPMLAAQHESTQTLDVSRNGKPAVFAPTALTKLSKRGYQFDGTNYAQTASGLISSAISEITVACAFILPTSQTQTVMEFSTVGSAEYGGLINNSSPGLIAFFCGGVSGNQAAKFTFDPSKRLLIVIGVHDGVNTRINVNGEYGANALVPTPPGATANSIVSIGSRVSPGTIIKSGAIIYEMMILPFALTPLQVADLHGNSTAR